MKNLVKIAFGFLIIFLHAPDIPAIICRHLCGGEAADFPPLCGKVVVCPPLPAHWAPFFARLRSCSINAEPAPTFIVPFLISSI